MNPEPRITKSDLLNLGQRKLETVELKFNNYEQLVLAYTLRYLPDTIHTLLKVINLSQLIQLIHVFGEMRTLTLPKIADLDAAVRRARVYVVRNLMQLDFKYAILTILKDMDFKEASFLWSKVGHDKRTFDRARSEQSLHS